MNKSVFNLYIHIGAGKTGSSSIQESLQKSSKKLSELGFCYWGLLLENAPIREFSWQNKGKSEEFINIGFDRLVDEIVSVLERAIQRSKTRKLHSAIWSNEWFFENYEAVLEAASRVKSESVSVKIIAYVRRHDSWSLSAYTQWGIKHKTYAGNVLDFSSYTRKRPPAFFNLLKPWSDRFGSDFRIYNFDVVDDVVTHFYDVVGLPEGLDIVRNNESPSPEEILLRYLFNNSIPSEAHPVVFDRAFAYPSIDPKLDVFSVISSIMPDQSDLKDVLKLTGSDRDELNTLLREQGQLPLSESEREWKNWKIDPDRLLSLLTQLFVAQTKKVLHLQHLVNELRNESKD